MDRTNDARCAEAPRATGYLAFEPPKMLQPVAAAGAAAFFDLAEDFFAFVAFFALGAALAVALWYFPRVQARRWFPVPFPSIVDSL